MEDKMFKSILYRLKKGELTLSKPMFNGITDLGDLTITVKKGEIVEVKGIGEKLVNLRGNLYYVSTLLTKPTNQPLIYNLNMPIIEVTSDYLRIITQQLINRGVDEVRIIKGFMILIATLVKGELVTQLSALENSGETRYGLFVNEGKMKIVTQTCKKDEKA